MALRHNYLHHKSMRKLSIRVLGALSVDDERIGELSLPRKYKAVLSALALAGPAGLSREKLVDLFWEDSGEKQAQASLRQALASIRKGLAAHSHCLLADQGQIAIEDTMIALDATEFEALASSESEDDRARALALYKGDLLDGVKLKEEGFESWLRPMRERLRGKAIALLRGRLESAGDIEGSVGLASQLLELEPTSEFGHRALMRTYAAQGRNNAALKQFTICRDILDRELEVAPSRETVALFETIKNKRRNFSDRDGSDAEQTKKDSIATLPEKSSIAVLPFDNMSGDPDQEYFADGIAEDVITALSRFRSLFVIARGSTFTYKHSAIDITQVASELGVRYIVDGSVRKVEDRVRITVRLTDATNRNNLWADRFDGTLEDVFDLQDQITERIVVAIEPEIEARERARARRKPPENLDAWELVQRGLSHFNHINRVDRAESIRLFREAAALDPDFSTAHAHLAYALSSWVLIGGANNTANALMSAREKAERAVSLDPNEPMARIALGRTYLFAGEVEMAIGEMQTAIAINPNFAWGHFGLGYAYHRGASQAEEALQHYDTALRLNPRDPMRFVILMLKGSALRFLRRHDEAINSCRKACQFPDIGFIPHMHLAAALAEAGQTHEARSIIKKLTQIEPALSITFLRRLFVAAHDSFLNSLFDSLRKAGIAE